MAVKMPLRHRASDEKRTRALVERWYSATFQRKLEHLPGARLE
jgi:hypothetical protein